MGSLQLFGFDVDAIFEPNSPSPSSQHSIKNVPVPKPSSPPPLSPSRVNNKGSLKPSSPSPSRVNNKGSLKPSSPSPSHFSQENLTPVGARTQSIADRQDELVGLLDSINTLAQAQRTTSPKVDGIKSLILWLVANPDLLSVLLHWSTTPEAAKNIHCSNMLFLSIRDRSIHLVAFAIAAGFDLDVAGSIESVSGDNFNGIVLVKSARDLCDKMTTAVAHESKNKQKVVKDILNLIKSSPHRISDKAASILKKADLPIVTRGASIA